MHKGADGGIPAQSLQIIKMKKRKKKTEFSKLIIIIETMLVLYVTYRVLGFIDRSIDNSFTGSLPYLTTLIGAVWGAYGTSISFYYNKAKTENKIKIEKNIRRDY